MEAQSTLFCCLSLTLSHVVMMMPSRNCGNRCLLAGGMELSAHLRSSQRGSCEMTTEPVKLSPGQMVLILRQAVGDHDRQREHMGTC